MRFTSRAIRAARQAKETHKWANPGAHLPGKNKAARPCQVKTACNTTNCELTVQPSREGLQAQPA